MQHPVHLQIRRLAVASLTLWAAVATTGARAQGIPVIDAANLIQTIQQVNHDITAISNQVQQIAQLQAQLSSMNGQRLLGLAANNPGLQNYVPANAYAALNAVTADGYGALGDTARALRDATMIYNCLDLAGSQRTQCQASLAQPYQHKGLLQDAMVTASGRLGQITALMSLINGTTDPKAVQEIQARIGAENALMAHEISQVQMLQAMADSEERIARARDRERQYEMLNRTGRIASYLP